MGGCADEWVNWVVGCVDEWVSLYVGNLINGWLW